MTLRQCSLITTLIIQNINVQAAPNNLGINSVDELVAFFPRSVSEINQRLQEGLLQARQEFQAILAIPAEQRTFANTVLATDRLSLSPLKRIFSACQILSYVSPDEQIRSTSGQVKQTAELFFIEVSNSADLFNAFKVVQERVNNQQESITAEQHYYLEQMMRSFVRNGLNLPEHIRNQVIQVQKELVSIEQAFAKNIASDNRTITATEQELAGVNASVMQALPRDEQGNCLVGVDYPTVTHVMENCAVEATRKRLQHAFNDRAYPANDAVLKQLIAHRDELARLLGFTDFAHFNLDDSMVGSPERAHQFLDELIVRAQKKTEQEYAELKKIVPQLFSANGLMPAWNSAYAKGLYKKQSLELDEDCIAEYFPMEHTITQLLDIYRQFLGIEFKEVPVEGLWHRDVKLICVYDQGACVGYLLLDLYPRPDKYTHACHIGVTPAVFDQDGQKPAKISIVIANFPKPMKGKPSLLRRENVKTFFHEFGHALHSILGRTSLASFAGTSVKRDFVELPSQMLEEWLWDKDILKKVSSHYITGEPLSDELICQIKKLKHFETGHYVLRLAYLAKVSLAMFAEDANKDPYQIMQNCYQVVMRCVEQDLESHFYAAFGHLTIYAAQYYGYLWSRVFAVDLFYEIAKVGLLNPEIGKKYIKEVIGKGGSENPNDLLRNFLGREPNSDAFFADLGI